MAATVVLGKADPEKPGIPGFLVQLAGKCLGFFPLVDVRKDLALDKATHRVTDLLMGFVEIFLDCSHAVRLRLVPAKTLPSACLVINRKPLASGYISCSPLVCTHMLIPWTDTAPGLTG
ncbi:hypothetical protein D3C77_639210 [compost metagenome]